jgi:hypothetical protein
MNGAFITIFWSLLILYALLVAFQVFGQVFGKKRWVELAPHGVAVGLLVHTALVAWRWVGTPATCPPSATSRTPWSAAGSSS